MDTGLMMLVWFAVIMPVFGVDYFLCDKAPVLKGQIHSTSPSDLMSWSAKCRIAGAIGLPVALWGIAINVGLFVDGEVTFGLAALFFTGGSVYMFAQDVMQSIKYRAAAQERLLQEAVARGVEIGMKKAKES